MTTTVNKATTIYDAFMDVFSMDARDPRQEKMGDWPQDCLFEGTASESLEKISLGTPDDLPTDATRMSKALSEIEPRLKALKPHSVTVDRFTRDKQRIIKIDVR